MFDFLGMFGNHEERKIGNTEVDGGVVDTCEVNDSAKPYETGIAHPCYHDGKWIIVELYDTKEEAVEGHNRWVRIMEEKPVELMDRNQSTMGDICEALGGTIRLRYRRMARG